MLKEELRNREELESTVSMPREHIHYYQHQMNELKRKNEDLEQYGRRLFVRIEGIPSVENETSGEVLDKVMSLMQEAECGIPEVVIDRAHRIDKSYVEKNSKKICKSIIVRFATCRYRTKFYWSRIKLENNVKVKLDFTKSRYTVFTKAIETVKLSIVVDYVMVDINCWLKVVFKSSRSKIFTDGGSLKRAIDEKEID